MSAYGPGCVKTIFENSKWKLAASLWALSLVEWVIQVNISSIINQLWEKVFHQRQLLEFSHSLGRQQSFGFANKLPILRTDLILKVNIKQPLFGCFTRRVGHGCPYVDCLKTGMLYCIVKHKIYHLLNK